MTTKKSLKLVKNQILSVYVCVFAFSVLDLNAFERQNKAEGLGMDMDENSGTALIGKHKRKNNSCETMS